MKNRIGMMLFVMMFASFSLMGCGTSNDEVKDEVSTADVGSDYGDADFEREVAEEMEGIANPNGMPRWVKKLGLSEPDSGKFQKNISYEATEKTDGYEAVELVYHGDYADLVKDAKEIAEDAGFDEGSMSTNSMMAMMEEEIASMKEIGMPQSSIDQIRANMEKQAKFVVYANFDIMSEDGYADVDVDLDLDYMMSVVVEGDVLTIAVVDWEEAQKDFEEEQKDFEEEEEDYEDGVFYE